MSLPVKQRPAAISKTLERLEEIKNAKHKQISANMAVSEHTTSWHQSPLVAVLSSSCKADIQSHDVVRSAKRAVTWRK